MKNLIYIFTISILFACNTGNKKNVNTENVAIPLSSIYNLTDTFITDNNEPITLSKFKNKPTVIGMIFTNCTFACPRLTLDIVDIEKALNTKDVNFVMVSFDTERDKPEVLKEFHTKMRVNENWTFLTSHESAIRKLSILLNVQYEKDGDGNFSHSNIVSVLDKSGVLVYRKEGLKVNHDETVKFIKTLL
jgi:protein SCO1/2